MTVPINVNNYDPLNTSSGPVRALSGPINTGAVDFDVSYEGLFARWLYIGTTGNLSYVKYDGTTETLPNILGGIWHPIHSIKINSSGTDIAEDQLRWGS